VPEPAGDRERGQPSDHCWGKNPVIALLEADPARCLKVIISKTMRGSASEKIINLCGASGVPYSFLESRAMNGIIGTEDHQGVIATVSPMRLLTLEEAVELIPEPPEHALIVLLDHIQDPHNLGAMIRSAETVGAVLVALPLRRSSLPTGTVAKTSAGASARLPIASVGNVAYAVRKFQEAGLWTIGLDANAKESIYGSSIPSRALMVVGSEDGGLGRTTAAACDELLRIPIKGMTGSLNASVALAIGMFEWARVNNFSARP
jgi:23S rRNA (guanosine2251-2'-O)-methyltransferase